MGLRRPFGQGDTRKPRKTMGWNTQEMLTLLPVLILSLTVHEFAHARTALAFGDPTAKQMGRVSLNPLRHLDLMGSIVFLVTRAIGWAKPVPVNYAYLRPPRLGRVMVSIAGPVSNLMMAFTAGLLLRFGVDRLPPGGETGSQVLATLRTFLLLLMVANISLFVFNLLPLFPLDGHHVLRDLLPHRWQGGFMSWQLRFGRPALLALIFIPVLLERSGKQFFSPIAYVRDHVLEWIVSLVWL